jgi:peroxiredoxin
MSLSAMLLIAGLTWSAPAPGPAVGMVLPDYALLDVHRQPVRPAALPEPVLVLNFFAFWCDTWIAELPQLRELAAQQQRLGFRLLSVSIDGTWREQLRLVCGHEELPFSMLLDLGGRLSERMNVRRVPTLLVVDRERRVTYVHEGFPGNPALLRAVREASASRSGAPAE